MPRDASNAYALPEAPFLMDTDILPDPVNRNFADLGAEITASLRRSEIPAIITPLLGRDPNGNVPVGRGAGPDERVLFNVAEGFLGNHTVNLTQLNREVGNLNGAISGSAATLLPLNGTRAMAADLPMGGFRAVNMAQGVADTDAMRMDQSFVRLASVQSPAAMADVRFTLPAGYGRFKLEIDDMTPASNAAMFVRFSIDGGATFLSLASDYNWIASQTTAAAITPSGANESFIRISAATAQLVFGSIDFAPFGPAQVQFRSSGYTGTAQFEFRGAGRCTNPNTVNAVQVGFISVGVARAYCTLYGSRRQ